mmetsp:Transcript_3155/g.7112  ORF Transcript_3155/g.7112 Transcript_3155/m.7112 type:complete len:228 (+) Transcript_3155:125-808(+)
MDRQTALTSLRKKGSALRLPEYAAWRADKELVMAAMVQDGRVLECADSTLRADKELVLAAVKQCGLSLRFADASLLTDKEVVMSAVMQNETALLHVDSAGLLDRAFLSDLLRKLPEGTFRETQFFHVTALSGKSCCCLVLDGAYVEAENLELDDNIVGTVLVESAEKLGLEPGDVIKSGELVDVTTSQTIPDNDALHEFECGKMHELQLVVQSQQNDEPSAKKARTS